MIGWVARGLLIVAGFVASWFVAKDVPAVWPHAGGRGANSVRICPVGTGILARTLDPRVKPAS